MYAYRSTNATSVRTLHLASIMFALLLRNITAGLASAIGAQIWTKSMSHLVQTNIIQSKQARKLIHLTTAPLFMLTWPLYTSHAQASYIAASVPLLFSLRLLQRRKSDPFVTAVSRDGRPEEAAAGPAAYGVSMAALTAFAWRHNPAMYVAAAAMCVGDCCADIIGSALNGPRLPLPRKLFWKKKTLPGTVAFITTGVLAALGMLKVANAAASVSMLPMHVVYKSICCAAAVELLPLEDNFTVPFAAYLAVKWLAH